MNAYLRTFLTNAHVRNGFNLSYPVSHRSSGAPLSTKECARLYVLRDASDGVTLYLGWSSMDHSGGPQA